MQAIPSKIEIGMDVYDRNHVHIGKVDDFRFPENATDPGVQPAEIDAENPHTPGGILESLAAAFAGDPVPEPLRDRLVMEGYIRLDADGLFAADRFITPGQIAALAPEGLLLSVERDELVSRH